MRISPSQVQVWLDCPQKWHYSYREGLSPKIKWKGFDKGTYAHELLHVYYHTLEKTGEPGSPFAQAMMDSRMKNDMANMSVDNVDVMASIMPLIQRYVRNQSIKIDAGIQVVAIEHEFKFDFEGMTLHGFIDLLYRNKYGRLIVRDHKTSEKANEWYVEKLYLHGQFLMYALQHFLQTGELPAVEVNFINTYPYSPKNKKSDSEIFKLFRHEHTEEALMNYLKNLQVIHDKMVNDKPYRNFGTACNSCQFKQLCHLDVQGFNDESKQIVLSGFDKKEVTD